uniref:Uncharacterized protein n=1 Tax=Anopheles maculatus TaxID=74869 RepID=A0A182SDA1_9DIPT
MATNSHDLEVEKKYLADIERAKALSLETHELEKIRAKQRQMTPELASNPKVVSQTLEEYRAYLQRRVACGTGKVPSATPGNSLEPPPGSSSGPVRRHSDCRNPGLQAPALGSKAQDEADLISFQAVPKPPDPKEEARNNLKELVEQMHRLQSQPPATAAAAAGQYAEQSFKTQRSLSMSSASYGFQHAPYQPVGIPQQTVPHLQGPYNATSMQLVPYNSQASKPKPLTPEELHRLYNSPPLYAVVTAGGPAALVTPPVYPGAVTPAPSMYAGMPSSSSSYGTVPVGNYGPTASLPQAAPPVAPTPYGVTPGQPLYPSLQTAAMNGSASVANPETALVHVPKLATTGRSYSQPHSVITQALKRQSSPAREATPSTSGVVLRPKSDPTASSQQRLGAKGTDLIDLGFEDNPRVSVLEAFDPLLCGNRSSS